MMVETDLAQRVLAELRGWLYDAFERQGPRFGDGDAPGELATAALADVARRFVRDHVVDHHAEWDRAGLLPRELHRAAAAAGLLGVGFPEDVGGSGGSILDVLVRDEAMMEAGAGSGLMASLFTLPSICGCATISP